MPSAPRVSSVDLVRASAQTALLRVDVEGLETPPRAATLVAEKANEPERRLAPLPTPPMTGGATRFSFALPMALRLARLTLVIDSAELDLAVPPERSRQDAVAAVALREARARLAQLEEELAKRGSDDDPDKLRERLEHQLAEHRLLRAQLAKELQAARDQSRAIEEELQRAEFERERLATELEGERTGNLTERERLTERLQQAHARVEYLERRVVEVQAKSARPETA